MPKYLVNACCRASIQERWTVQAESEEAAMALVNDEGQVGGDILACEDEVLGEEEDRTVESAELIAEGSSAIPQAVEIRVADWLKRLAMIRHEMKEAHDLDLDGEAGTLFHVHKFLETAFDDIEYETRDLLMQLPDDEMPATLLEDQKKGSF